MRRDERSLPDRALGRPNRRRRCSVAAATVLALSFVESTARAAPQANSGLIAGVCGAGTRDAYWDSTCFYGGLHGDVLFGRDGPHTFGLGPYADVSTAAFDDLRLGSGVSALLPVDDAFPLVLSVGPYARLGDGNWEPGLSSRLFFGSRSYNYHGHYGLAAGLSAGLDYGLGESKETTIVIAAHVDGLVVAMPFILLYQWIRGPARD